MPSSCQEPCCCLLVGACLAGLEARAGFGGKAIIARRHGLKASLAGAEAPRRVIGASLVWGVFCQAVSERRIFLCSTWSRFLRPDPQYCKAGARRRCQGWPSRPPCGILWPCRPHLDSFEHDRALGAVGMTIRGEPAFRARINRATTLYSVGPGTRTMMHSCASAAKLRGGGPILFPGMKAKGGDRDPATSNRHRYHLALEAGRAETVERFLCNSAHKAGRRTTPSGIAPSRTSRHSAIRSLRASATIIVLRV